MGALSSLKRSIGLLTNTPSLWVVAFVYALVAVPLSVAGNLGSPLLSILGILGALAVGAFVVPFFLGGVVGLSSESLRGDVGLDTFLDEGKDNYLYMLGFTWIAGLVEFTWAFFVGIVAYFLILFVGLAIVFGVLAAGTSTVATVVGAVLGLVAVVVFALGFYLIGGIPILLVQFVPGAYVIEDRDPVDGLKRGLTLLRDNVVSVLGFDVTVFFVNLLVGLLPWVPVLAAWFLVGPDAVFSGPSFSPDPSTTPGSTPGGPGMGGTTGGGFSFTALGAALYGATMLVVTPVQTAFLAAYYTSFFHDVAGDGDGLAGGDADPDATDWKPADDAAA